VEFAGFAIETVAIPVKDTVGSVAVLLDFHDEKSLTDCVKTTAWDENTLSRLGGGPMQGLFDIAILESLFKGIAGDSLLQPCIDGGTGRSVQKIPAFRLGLASQFGGTGDRRMHLNGEAFPGVKQFDEQWKTGGGILAMTRAEDLLAMVVPEFVEGFSLERTAMHDALRLGPVHHLPEFTNRYAVGDRFAKKSLKTVSSPNAFHGEWFKEERGRGSHEVVKRRKVFI